MCNYYSLFSRLRHLPSLLGFGTLARLVKAKEIHFDLLILLLLLQHVAHDLRLMRLEKFEPYLLDEASKAGNRGRRLGGFWDGVNLFISNSCRCNFQTNLRSTTLTNPLPILLKGSI